MVLVAAPLLAQLTVAALIETCPLSRLELHDGGAFLTNMPAPAPQPLVNCTQYRHQSCCTSEDSLRISHGVPEIVLQRTTRGCRDALHMIMCAPCSPAQSQLFAEEMVAGFPIAALRTCEGFCDRLYRSCASSHLVLAHGRAPDRVDVLFSGGVSFCRAVGFRVVRSEDAAACFSSAPSGHTNAVRAQRGGISAALGVLAAASLLGGRRR